MPRRKDHTSTPAPPINEEEVPSSGHRLRPRARALVISDNEEEEEAPRPNKRSRGEGPATTTSPPTSNGTGRLRSGRDRQPPPRSRGQQRPQSSSEEEEGDEAGGTDFVVDFAGDGRRLTQDEMVKHGVHHFIVTQGSLQPIRKSDFIRLVMNKQSAEYREVIDKVADELSNTFGFILKGMKSGGLENSSVVKCELMEATAFIMISKFRQCVVTQMAATSGSASGGMKKDLVKAALLLILSATYMLDRSIDEDSIWQMLSDMELSQHVCKTRGNLSRFLKTEFVDTLYLSKLEDKSADPITVRYGWGFRAETEISKYALLKHVAEKILGKNLMDYPAQFTKISGMVIARIDAEDERMKQVIIPSGSNSEVELSPLDVE